MHALVTAPLLQFLSLACVDCLASCVERSARQQMPGDIWEQQGCRLGSTSKSKCGALLIDFGNPVIQLFLLLPSFQVKTRAILNLCKLTLTQPECLRGHLIERRYKKHRSRTSSSQRKASCPSKVNGICFFTASAVTPGQTEFYFGSWVQLGPHH